MIRCSSSNKIFVNLKSRELNFKSQKRLWSEIGLMDSLNEHLITFVLTTCKTNVPVI